MKKPKNLHARPMDMNSGGVGNAGGREVQGGGGKRGGKNGTTVTA